MVVLMLDDGGAAICWIMCVGCAGGGRFDWCGCGGPMVGNGYF